MKPIQNFSHSPLDETVEFAAAVKAVCDIYNIKQEDLEILGGVNFPFDSFKNVRFKKRIPILFPVSPELTPNNGNPYLYLNQVRTQNVDIYGLPKVGTGLAELEITGKRKVRFWSWIGAGDFYLIGHRTCLFVHKDDVFKLLRAVSDFSVRKKGKIEPPVLPQEMLKEIYDNSIGFLLEGEKHKSTYEKFKIPFKRGILLCGTPGCGKTMTCKWLRELCVKHKILYRVVSMEDYNDAAHRGRIRSLFKLHSNKHGIIFFDDMDVMVQDRKKSGSSFTLSTFLSELDGINPSEGVVFVFTTNYIEELDGAFVRPGRIDLWLPFKPPSPKLREKYLDAKFDPEIFASITENSSDKITKEDILKKLVEKTDEYTFAEIEEIRKLFCMDLIAKKGLNIDKTFGTFDRHRKDFAERAKMGFRTMSDLEDDSGDEEDYSMELDPSQISWGDN